ncbi:MAG TPA: spore coat protein, partial [Spirochaeta sp.]|nr:spore coat protein [Spirochaeta sp.]
MNDQKKSNTSRIFIIAEIGTSHNGDLDRASMLIDAAAAAGAGCVKTQIIFADEIIHPKTGVVELPGGSIRLFDRFLELEQDFEFYRKLKNLTEAAGLEFLASPFGYMSLDWLLKLGCKMIKIASPELNHFPLLELAAGTGKKLLLSTGVSKLSDIEAALNCIASVSETARQQAVLMHCITSYPAPEEEYNLNVIPALSGRFGIPAGVSDHSLDPVM